MKTRKLSKQVRDNVVEKYRSELGSKNISETLNIPRSTIKLTIKKLKENGTTTPAKRGKNSRTCQGGH
jgi:transposase